MTFRREERDWDEAVVEERRKEASARDWRRVV